MARSTTRASITGSRNNRFSNTTGNLDLQVDLKPSPTAPPGTANVVEAGAYSQNGSSNDATASAATTENAGIVFSSPGSTGPSAVIRSSRAGRVQVRGATNVIATAAREPNATPGPTNPFVQTTGFAEASANFNGLTGGIINDASNNRINQAGADRPGSLPNAPAPDIKIAQAGQVDVQMTNVADALAAGEQGAVAQADMGSGFFGIKDTGIQISGGAANTVPGGTPESQVVADITGGIFATAQSTVGDASANAGTLSDTTEVVGIYNGLVSGRDASGNATSETLKISFGSSGLVDANANLAMGSSASTEDGDANATTQLALAAGIYNADNGTDASGTVNDTFTTNLLIEAKGPLSVVNGNSSVQSEAFASSNSGEAIATIQSNLIGGIVDQRTFEGGNPAGTRIAFGSSGTVRANAFADNVAYAESTGNGVDASYAEATINNDAVIGLAMDVVADGSLSIEASATSIQNATAIGDNFDGGSDPYTSVGRGDFVSGITNSEINSLGNLQGVSIGATLVANATAESDQGTGGTTGESGIGSDVVGLNNSSLNVLGGLQLDGSTAQNFNISATSNLSASATSASDDVTAFTGGNLLNRDIAFISGIYNSDVNVLGGGPSQGALNVDVSGNADAEAITQNGDATTAARMVANGIENSTIFLRGDSSTPAEGLNVTVNLSGSSAAEGSEALAESNFTALGIDLGDNNSIKIDRNGSVTASTSVTTPRTSATAVGGGTADAESDLRIGGIFLDGTNNTITIGDNGNIEGSATLTDALVTADAASSSGANANNDFSIFGIDGDAAPSVTAGRSSGNVEGQAYATGIISANSVNGSADAVNSGLSLGIDDLNITAGLLSGGNAIVGISDTSFLTSATSTGSGNARASSSLSGLGFRGFGNSMRVSGNITAQATLSNVVVATANLGTAEAESNGTVVGIENYSASTIGPSTIRINAGGTFTASSFGGSDTPTP